LEFAAALLPLWGFPPGTDVGPAVEQGTNNRTYLVRHGQQRYVLRVSGFLSVAEVRAEHRILQRLRQGGLPFQVPEPVTAPGGRTVIETPALGAPDWPRRTAAVLRGYASIRHLEAAEVAALPELLIVRSLGSVLWRVAGWRAGLGRFGEVTAHAGRLEATTRWLAASGDAFLSVAAAANAGS
jgi:Ser/Thr protein kinase RdoA (MazF antagonist)